MSGYDIFSIREILGGEPQTIYTFARAEKMWRYNNVGRSISIVYGAAVLTYAPALIKRGRIQRSQDTGGLTVHLQIARTVPIADWLRRFSTFPTYVGLHRWQPNAGAGALPPLQHFGTVANVALSEGWVECDVLSGETTWALPFPNKIFSPTCVLGTYDPDCAVDESLFTTAGTILAIDGGKITVDFVRPNWTHDEGSGPVTEAVPDTWYDGGMIRWLDDPLKNERAFVEWSDDSEFHILGPPPEGAAVGDNVSLIAGDDHTLQSCRKKFNNVRNFLGFDRMPVEDPMRTGFVA